MKLRPMFIREPDWKKILLGLLDLAGSIFSQPLEYVKKNATDIAKFGGLRKVRTFENMSRRNSVTCACLCLDRNKDDQEYRRDCHLRI